MMSHPFSYRWKAAPRHALMAVLRATMQRDMLGKGKRMGTEFWRDTHVTYRVKLPDGEMKSFETKEQALAWMRSELAARMDDDEE